MFFIVSPYNSRRYNVFVIISTLCPQKFIVGTPQIWNSKCTLVMIKSRLMTHNNILSFLDSTWPQWKGIHPSNFWLKHYACILLCKLWATSPHSCDLEPCTCEVGDRGSLQQLLMFFIMYVLSISQIVNLFQSLRFYTKKSVFFFSMTHCMCTLCMSINLTICIMKNSVLQV